MKIRIPYFFESLVCVYYFWYFLPICRAYLSSSIFKYFFFSLFVIGIVGILIQKQNYKRIEMDSSMIVLLIYMIIVVVFSLLNYADYSSHIRVSFTFWGTYLLYNSMHDQSRIVWIGKLLLMMYLITILTSSIGVLFDNSAARTIAHASTDDSIQQAILAKNIGNIYLFQGLTFFVPILLAFSKNYPAQYKLLIILLVLVILFVLINASFTIALIGYIVSLLSYLLFQNSKSKYSYFYSILTILLFSLLILNGNELLRIIADSLSNERVSIRLLDLREYLYFDNSLSVNSDVGLRLDLYKSSFNTFLKHPLGVGGYYSYVVYEKGIGYHSQILDDLARFGLFSIVFYICFFKGYYSRLKREWSKINIENMAWIIVVVYLYYLLFNIGFRSSEESILTLFITLSLPEIVISLSAKKGPYKGFGSS